jgi:hypothetical protein
MGAMLPGGLADTGHPDEYATLRAILRSATPPPYARSDA